MKLTPADKETIVRWRSMSKQEVIEEHDKILKVIRNWHVLCFCMGMYVATIIVLIQPVRHNHWYALFLIFPLVRIYFTAEDIRSQRGPLRRAHRLHEPIHEVLKEIHGWFYA